MVPKLKLKKGDVTIREIYIISKRYYYKQVDNKAERMKMDIVSARMVVKKYFVYDPHIKKWKQETEHKRHIKFEFIVTSDPISYTKTDTVKKHRYPVIFVFYDLAMGWNSSFRWRTGSLKKPIFVKKGASSQERLRIGNANIRRGIQFDFFFKLEALLAWFGLLYGPNLTSRQMPFKANPKMIPYLDKHALYVVEKWLRYILSKKGLEKLKVKIDNV